MISSGNANESDAEYWMEEDESVVCRDEWTEVSDRMEESKIGWQHADPSRGKARVKAGSG